MALNWVSIENNLLLNPRLQPEVRARYEFAWKTLVNRTLESQIGIATSGSSGEHGRLISLPKSSVLMSAYAVNDRLSASAQDIWLKTLPDFHVGGLGIHARAHMVGSKVVETRAEKWDPAFLHNELVSSGATLLSLVPTQLFDLVKAGFKSPSKLRAVLIGGGRLEETLRLRALEMGWPILPTYGMTEVCSQVATAISPHDPRLKPLSHVEVRIEEGGRIAVSSASLLAGQIVFDTKMNAHFTDPTIDGWFRTEDRGSLDSGGYLTVEGRAQDFVKIGGEGVVLSRLEEQLERVRHSTKFNHDAVVLAAADERLGAAIVLLTDGEADALVEEFNSLVMPFERIRAVHRVERLPKSSLGKILRTQALSLVGLKPVAHD